MLWMANPDAGSDAFQSGAWTYNVLPYIEQTALHDLGKGLKGEAREQALKTLMQTPVATFYCPSRRRASVYPGFGEDLKNYMMPKKVAKCDYAANSGDFFTGMWPGAPIEGEPEAGAWYTITNYTGIMHHRSEVKPSEVLDGLSKTYLLGEKLLDSRMYKTGRNEGDDQVLYVGADFDNCRWTRIAPTSDPLPPRRDDDLGGHPAQFGSAHPSGCGFVFCDGSVKRISYDVDADVHRWNGNRKDSAGKYHYNESAELTPIE